MEFSEQNIELVRQDLEERLNKEWVGKKIEEFDEYMEIRSALDEIGWDCHENKFFASCCKKGKEIQKIYVLAWDEERVLEVLGNLNRSLEDMTRGEVINQLMYVLVSYIGNGRIEDAVNNILERIG